MKRSPMPPRKKPLAPGPGPERKTRVRKRNPERQARLAEEQFGDHARWVRTLRCCVCGTRPTVAHHTKTRGAGGKADALVPLCTVCHDAVHTQGVRTFERRMGVDLGEIATRLAHERQGLRTDPNTWLSFGVKSPSGEIE